MSIWCSLVLPTRHRPQFVAQALAQFTGQQETGVELIVVDNPTDPAMRCETEVRDAQDSRVRYRRPPAPLSMVDNWSFALEQANGDYVGVLTDKIMLLPHALTRIRAALHHANEPEILSWVTDYFRPSAYPDYFGAGEYTAVQASTVCDALTAPFDPTDCLNEKGRAEWARPEQPRSLYCRGKLVFGVYHRELLARLQARFGALFRDVSPDYTSMVLALSEARSAAELASSAVVSIGTDLSNGGQTSSSDTHALRYLQQLSSGSVSELMQDMLVPGVYASQANTVARDYLAMRAHFDLDFEFSDVNWLLHCLEDVTAPERHWSSAQIRDSQLQLVYEAINALPAARGAILMQRFEDRTLRRASAPITAAVAGQQLSWPSLSLDQALRRRSAWR
jgi:glycosyltransferase involved in cell wall biosynthesis